MKKIFAFILAAIGLNTLLDNKAGASAPSDNDLLNFEREPITQLNLSSILPKIENQNPFEAASGILNQIGRYEANGNYNIIYGGSTAPLTNMTLDEVREFQEKMIAQQRAAGIPSSNQSSAVGKYQFIRKTFDATRSALGLSGDTKFTPEIQDQFAYYQLEQAGWERFLRGEITVTDMMKRISKIWASFPKDNTGVSYYAGVGNNKALVSPNQVKAELNKAIGVA